MNSEAKIYWDTFWDGDEPHPVNAWQFGCDPDELAHLVISGKKTATASAYACYEAENEPFPAVGDCSVILNSQDKPVAIIRTVDVQILPMNEVPLEFAIAEGEGDLSYEYWWDGHKKFFTMELAELGMEFSEDMLVVCETFELIDVKR
ncbi:MAG: ASCH domain-containing protein [Defluviitaleaceae bacterium]|nr:ASCH domain-containing protein [Defluviitaleaceae bacterium]